MKSVVAGVLTMVRLAWRQDRARLIVAAVLMLLQAVALPLSAPALGALTNAAIAGDLATASLAATIAAVLILSALTAGHFAHIYYFELGENAELAIQRRLIALSNGSVGLEHHERADYADKLQVLSQEINRTRDNFSALFSAFTIGAAMIVTAVLLGLLNPWLLLLPVAAIPPLLLGRRAESILARSRDAAAGDSRRAKHLLALLTTAGPAKELRACGVEGEIRQRQADSWNSASRILNRAQTVAIAPWVLGQLCFAAAYVGATLLVVADAVSGHRTVGDVILAITLASQANQQVTSAVAVLRDLQRAAKTMNDLDWIDDLVRDDRDASNLRSVPQRIRDGIEFVDVVFQYPQTERPVLDGVNLTLPAGSTVAIVGENGAGKTSLVKLLCRFYEANEGHILVDGISLDQFAVDEWRERISAGFQDFTRFEFTAQHTVGVGDLPERDSVESVTAALRRAKSEDILARLDDGLETRLGKSHSDGTELSGGQWQKLALGRAMMRERPLLLILDEPTSALDAQAEHELFEQYAVNATRIGKNTGAITLLISHRFSTVRMADIIIVVADGKVAESGSHDELMATGGLYSELYGLQATAYQ